jgi:lysophospholipase L1-like esterase
MRKLAIYGISILIAAVGLAASPVVAAMGQVQIPYVALGDSYSSGEGNGPFDGPCHRAKQPDAAYPRILPDLVSYLPPAPDFHACTGATTADIWERPQPHRRDQLAQLEYLSPVHKLVTISIGGNDLGFSRVLIRCLAPDNCTSTRIFPVVPKMEARLASIGPKLTNVYEDIRVLMDPDGYLVVAGYPHLFVAGEEGGCKLGISKAEAEWVNETVNRANGRIAAAVAAARARVGNVFYVDVRDQFAGHELCSKNSEWLYGLALSHHEGPVLFKRSYHPTRAGQDAYAEAIAAFLNRPGVRCALTRPSPRSAC